MKSYVQRCKEFWSGIESRKKECLADGHRKPEWFPYIVTNSSKHGNIVKGFCDYCLAPLERPLNTEEHERINKFYQSLDEPVTI